MSLLFSVIIFGVALTWITLTIRKHSSMKSLQLNSCNMIINFLLILLVCSQLLLAITIEEKKSKNLSVMICRVFDSFMLFWLLFTMQRFPNASSESKTHCSILKRDVPIIVMLQNRITYANYMR